MKITIGDYTTEINPDLLEGSGNKEIDFDGRLLVLLEKNDGKWRVINAMNGWGGNCYNTYKDCSVKITP